MKRTVLLLVVLSLFVGLVSCGSCDHTYQDACDAVCNECNEPRTPPHAWTEASCELPMSCSLCGETEGIPLGHSGGQATCLARAVCAACHREYGEIGTHLFSGKIAEETYLKKPAGLVDPAVYHYSCLYCREKGDATFLYGSGLYNDMFKSGAEGEAYLYFTDPHAVKDGKDATFSNGKVERFEALAELYSQSIAGFAVCGGDWLNHSNTKNDALNILGYIKAQTEKWFGNCHLIVGNHDYNYQLVTDGKYGRSPHVLSPSELAAVWFPEYGKTYYTFQTETSRYYVFDSGIDWDRKEGGLNDYDKEQVAWYLGQLAANDDRHIVLMPHMVYVSSSSTWYHAGTEEYAKISAAYNARESYTFEGKTYDFSQKTGKVEYIIAGHSHRDEVGALHGIPYVLTLTNSAESAATADFVYADYEARELHLFRVGNGENRIVSLIKN